ncbi:MAG: DNA/RNA nuclease SfsA [Proteobacteria bacterium]|nr:DNA/RNA nuclease SfsA [Pseudomonadota bacterium]
MKFNSPLIKGTLNQRNNRFVCEVTIDSGVTLAHVPNTGRMTSCYSPGCEVYLSKSANHNRKLPYTWELSCYHHDLICVNTQMSNELVATTLMDKSPVLAEFNDYSSIKREVTYNHQNSDSTTSSSPKSRIDIYLSNHKTKPNCYIEIKHVTLYCHQKRCVMFPDAPTTRGQKHLRALIDIAQTQQAAATMMFVVTRNSGDYFTPARDIDPEYAALLTQAQEVGVNIVAFKATVEENGLILSKQIPVELNI